MDIRLQGLALLLACGCQWSPTQAQQTHRLENAFPGVSFARPVDIQHAGDGSNRIFVVEQAGVIKVLEQDRTSATVFLDIQSRVRDSGNEEGLLGLAFHPDFGDNGYFYVNYTASNPHRSVVARYTVLESGLADPSSEFVLMEELQPASNHNGGQIAFGPDGYLYISFGDGGGAGDRYGNGQDLSTVLGAILRIDVDSDFPSVYSIPDDNPFVTSPLGARGEIYAYGLRNVWRFSFDSESGLLYAADVGQSALEEIDLIELGGNYGWPIMEGTNCFRPSTNCNKDGLTLPIHEYGHIGGGKSITGGYVYRGSNVSDLVGRYIYADYLDGRIWALSANGDGSYRNDLILDTHLSISSFGVDEAGELYVCAFDSRIYRFSPTPTSIDDGPDNGSHLEAAFPNPFRTSTLLQYHIAEPASVDLGVYAVDGRRVCTLVQQALPAGPHSTTWDGKDRDGKVLPAGVYFARLMVHGAEASSRRIVLTR